MLSRNERKDVKYFELHSVNTWELFTSDAEVTSIWPRLERIRDSSDSPSHLIWVACIVSWFISRALFVSQFFFGLGIECQTALWVRSCWDFLWFNLRPFVVVILLSLSLLFFSLLILLWYIPCIHFLMPPQCFYSRQKEQHIFSGIQEECKTKRKNTHTVVDWRSDGEEWHDRTKGHTVQEEDRVDDEKVLSYPFVFGGPFSTFLSVCVSSFLLHHFFFSVCILPVCVKVVFSGYRGCVCLFVSPRVTLSHSD